MHFHVAEIVVDVWLAEGQTLFVPFPAAHALACEKSDAVHRWHTDRGVEAFSIIYFFFMYVCMIGIVQNVYTCRQHVTLLLLFLLLLFFFFFFSLCGCARREK